MRPIDRFYNLGLTEAQIAERAHRERINFGVADANYVDIIEILEFKIYQFIPNFKLLVRRDIELQHSAETTIEPPRIIVKETIYDAACEGDPHSRRILAHELAHLLLHTRVEGPMQRSTEVYEQQISKMNALESSEDQADIFARHFLVPTYLAFSQKQNVDELSRITGSPKNVAAAAITVSKRQEMSKLRSYKSKSTAKR